MTNFRRNIGQIMFVLNLVSTANIYLRHVNIRSIVRWADERIAAHLGVFAANRRTSHAVLTRSNVPVELSCLTAHKLDLINEMLLSVKVGSRWPFRVGG